MAPKNILVAEATEENNAGEQESPEYLKAGKLLANPPPGEDVVITGMAGRFPDSDDIYHYLSNLKNKVDMVSGDTRRWEHTHPEIPQRTGKINCIEKFDAGFFGVHHRQADAMDPLCRQVLERSVEAVMDAGFHPEYLRGTNTGVFIGACFSESEKYWFYNKLQTPSHGFMGCTRSMQAQFVSNYFGLEGPSHTIDTACSSSLYAFEHAYRAIRMGKCDAAFVGGTSLCLHPLVSLQFARLGVLSLDGSCKSFDADANGYARSETAAVIFLQKSKDARRIYAQVVHSKANCDGFKEQGITYPSGPMQKYLLEEVYQECNVDPRTVDILEAHATGTKVGDPEEILAMDEVFCVNRKTPLYVGSIKSNLGHAEAASGMCSLVKILIGMDNNCLLPNINYDQPREGAEALEKGRMVVVTEPTPWPKDGSGLAAINSFGFGGGNAHVLLKRFLKPKINGGLPRDGLPRLVCVSGRTEDSIRCILDDIQKRTLDVEYIRLLQEVFRTLIDGHRFRGYLVMSKTGELCRSISLNAERHPLCLVFGEPNEKWLKIANDLFSIPLFAASIQRTHNVLCSRGINITEIITKGSTNDVVTMIVGHLAIQIALVDILNALALTIDYIIGYSIGELAAAYAEGSLTLEQTLLSGCAIGQCLNEQSKHLCYQVELRRNDVIKILPPDINCMDNGSYCKIFGPSAKMLKVINKLENDGVTVKEAKSTSAFHSVLTTHLSSKMLQRLKEVIVAPKKRSPKWISTSINKREEGSEVSNYASAEYFVDILTSPVLFSDAISMLPSKAILVKIGAEFRELDHINKIDLVEMQNNNVQSLLTGLGRIYQFGHDLRLEKLYPKVQWPLSVGTPMLSPIIKWDHNEDLYVAYYQGFEKINSGERIVSFSVKEVDWMFVSGHVIDGRNLVPATAYLLLVWETFSIIKRLLVDEMQIVFENVRFLRATTIPKNTPVEFIVTVHKETGDFEVAEVGQSIVTGRILIPENISEEFIDLPIPVGEQSSIPLSTKDIYKELKLRGYNYMGAFRGLRECDASASRGLIEWTGNWIAFMDNMLQIKLLGEDTRNLYVPTSIEHLAIDARTHVNLAKQLGEKPLLPVFVHKELDIIKCGSVEIRGLFANSIPRRKPLGEPVLESYKFIPFEEKLSTEHSVRVAMQLLIENHIGVKLRVVEVLEENADSEETVLGPIIHQVLGDIPQIQTEIVVLSKQKREIPHVTVEDRKLSLENKSCAVVVVSRLLERPELKEMVLNALKETGAVLSREAQNFDVDAYNNSSDLEILTIYELESEKLVLLRKNTVVDYGASKVVDLSENLKFNWLSTVQNAVKDDETIVLFAQNSPLSGILGFVNCLRREPGGANAKCVFIQDDNAPPFDINNSFYLKQLKKGLAINVYKNGKWGSYRHLKLPEQLLVQREHIFNNVTVRGDFSSLRWIEGPLTSKSLLPTETIMTHVYYSCLNFRDVMTASGRISSDMITRDRVQQYNVQGFEFSGRDPSGRRVMGMITSGALASVVKADTYLIWEVPENLTMEEASTIPVTYGTVLHGLAIIGKIKEGQSILIHAGTGGVGQAAINVASYYKCNIFTTVGTEEKREYIRAKFPHIPESHIGNSRDTSFEQMIFKETEGVGVDFVLNSLSEEKLQASVRCLAPGGKFLEIGKFDLANNNIVGFKNFTEGRSFHGIMLDAFFEGEPIVKVNLHGLVLKMLQNGCIKSLDRRVFKEDEVEDAFRYMASGKHKGKVIIKLRDEEFEKNIIPKPILFNGIPRFYGNPEKSYIISGGLGGFGLELADWLVLRGVRKLVLVSRTGLKTGYQASRIRIWNGYGAVVNISTADTTTREGCIALLEEANLLGSVDAIFNLAVVLQDAVLENQTEDNFITSLMPKAIATQHFDILSREMCPHLQHFVVFSSVVCGRGNVGQTNYGMSNAIMERICEKRKSEGYPALAIQWGAIGEVGLVADMQELQTEIEIGGTLQQRITSCLEVMDTFMRQEEVIVSSIVVAEKKGGSGGADNIIDAVKNILGLRDLKTVSLHSSLSELGMDSMMAIEIKQTLEREYEVFLTAKDIRSMTFARLQEIAQEKASADEGETVSGSEREKMPQGVFMLLRVVGDEENSAIPVIRMTSLIKEKSVAPKVFLLPGIEGMATVLEPLAVNLASHAICLQYPYKDEPENTVEDLAKLLLPQIQENLPKSTPFTLVAYSYGCIVGLELVSLLEAEGRIGRLILVDGSPAMFKEFIKQQIPEAESPPLLQTIILCVLMQLYIPVETVMSYKAEIYNCNTFEDRVNFALSKAPKDTPHSERYRRQVCLASYERMNSVLLYQPSFPKLKSMVKLFKPSRSTIEGFDEDYKLQELCENPVEIAVYEGNHLTILKNPQIAYAINTILDTSNVFFKQSLIKDKAEVDIVKQTTVKQI